MCTVEPLLNAVTRESVLIREVSLFQEWINTYLHCIRTQNSGLIEVVTFPRVHFEWLYCACSRCGQSMVHSIYMYSLYNILSSYPQPSHPHTPQSIVEQWWGSTDVLAIGPHRRPWTCEKKNDESSKNNQWEAPSTWSSGVQWRAEWLVTSSWTYLYCIS